jgi:hypothetical protein
MIYFGCSEVMDKLDFVLLYQLRDCFYLYDNGVIDEQISEVFTHDNIVIKNRDGMLLLTENPSRSLNSIANAFS